MASHFSIAVDLSNLIPANASLTVDTFPHLADAVRQLAEAAHAQWTSYALGAPMPNGMVISSRSGEYARSILLHQTGPFSAEVSSTLPYADAIENGSPARDMKKMLGSSPKVRMSKKGKRYLIIQMRWNTPGSVLGHAMPQNVYDWWTDKTRSVITSTSRRVSGQPGFFHIKSRSLYTVASRQYKWGSRLVGANLEDLGHAGRAARRMAGMVAFHDPTAQKGSQSGKYLTFRAMVEGSRGWVAPAQPGKFPARQVADQIQKIAQPAFEEAMKRDIAALLALPT